MTCVELSFPLVGAALSNDCGYQLCAGLKRCLEEMGNPDALPRFLEHRMIGVHVLRRGLFGRRTPGRDSALRIRLPIGLIPDFLPLAGRRLRVGNDLLRVGVPRVCCLSPSLHLYARIVTIKGFQAPDEFLAAARRQLQQQGLSDRVELTLPLHRSGSRRGEPVRRVLHVRGKRIVGFGVEALCESSDYSLRLQSKGLGGRRHFGAGIFLPQRHAAEDTTTGNVQHSF